MTDPPPKDQFWRNVWLAIQRAIALIIFKGVHMLVDHMLNLDTPPDMRALSRLVSDGLWVMFMLIYSYLGWEMIAVFIPQMRRKHRESLTNGATEGTQSQEL